MKINPVGRRVESLGDDRRDFDHSRSAATVVQELHVSNQTQFLVGVDMDRTRASNGQAGVKFLDIATAQRTIENTLVQQHSASVQRSLTVDQTATITIPARTHLVATLHWMRTWEDGVVVLGSAAGPVAEVPYSVTVGLHFDMTTEDVKA